MKNLVSFHLSATLATGLIVGLFALCIGCHTNVPQSSYDNTDATAGHTNATADNTPPNPRPKKIFAHYMGCFPAASLATAHHRFHDSHPRHDSENVIESSGGRINNWDLIRPERLPLSLEEGVGLDIERAVRAGFDGFALDAWAGNEAPLVLDKLFEYAEQHHPDFKITICMDPTCLVLEEDDKGKPNRIATFTKAIKYMLDKHGDSPVLAKRDGKPLVFNYLSCFMINDLPLERENWHHVSDGFKEVEKRLGQEIYWHFAANEMSFQLHGEKRASRQEAYEWASRHFHAVGEFICDAPDAEFLQLATAVKANGAEWSQPMWHQYENRGTGTVRFGSGFERLRKNWQLARDLDSTLIQYITWNDYGENTQVSPGYDTNYAILELNRYFIEWWKQGREPVVDRDKIFVAFNKYPENADVFPFLPRASFPHVLEVLVILTKEARVVVPGFDEEGWDAPVGLSFRQYPITEAGEVSVELVRGGKNVLSLTAPEQITDRPFRGYHSFAAYSTECLNHWEIDFPGEPFLAYSEYGDEDGDGLPNWFEMYWFGKWLDFTTQTVADANAPASDGMTNLEKYKAQQNPFVPRREYAVGDVWTREQIIESGQCFNPERDFASNKTWYYLYRIGHHNQIPHEGSKMVPMEVSGMNIGGRSGHLTTYRRSDPEWHPDWFSVEGYISHVQRADGKWLMYMKPRLHVNVALGWKAPVSGVYLLTGKLNARAGEGHSGITCVILHEDNTLQKYVLSPGESMPYAIEDVHVAKGEMIYFISDCTPQYDVDTLDVEDFTITLKELL